MSVAEAAAHRAARVQALRGGVVVSVQAEAHEPFYADAPFGALAEAVVLGGAAGLRVAGTRHLALARARWPELPLIALSKPDPIPANFREIVYITPGVADVAALAVGGVDIVALDATDRPRPGGETLGNIVARVRETWPGLALMADCATEADARRAEALGFDLVSTTLSGYTQQTHARDNGQPDLDLLSAIAANSAIPVVCEGRIWEPAHVAEAFARGAFCVVIGSALTRPHLATRRFVQAAPGV